MAVKPIAVEMDAISKRFGGVHALREVSLSVRRGEIHALLGENGAGKSTILKILRGVQAPDSGSIIIDGEAFERLSPQLARQKGIGMIFQEMSLVPTLTVAQNVFLANEPLTPAGLIDDRAMERRSAEIFASMGVDVDPAAIVADLSTGQQQLTEIAKALSQNAEVLVLDEPTSALTAGEVDILFDLLRRLKAEGKAIIYVSHRMDEIFRIADHATVLRDGRLIDSRPIADYTLATLIADIMGKATRDLSEFATDSTAQDEVILKVEHLSSKLRRGGRCELFAQARRSAGYCRPARSRPQPVGAHAVRARADRRRHHHAARRERRDRFGAGRRRNWALPWCRRTGADRDWC